MADKNPDPIATEALFVGGVRAHNEGDTVPAANVGPNGWGDKVRYPGGSTPAAKKTKAAAKKTKAAAKKTAAAESSG